MKYFKSPSIAIYSIFISFILFDYVLSHKLDYSDPSFKHLLSYNNTRSLIDIGPPNKGIILLTISKMFDTKRLL